nr:MAG TPA: hypothetical protein [Bacteriophage sp.]DAV23458.1 MAG TPA: hypothetical protein [Bacteriophage sp.]DAZ80811.1 MAG TPA: hypothetical protein [Caudoviricetes sp.]
MIFHTKIVKNILSLHSLYRGYHKTTYKIIKTVIVLSYFYAKNKSNREYINRNS